MNTPILPTMCKNGSLHLPVHLQVIYIPFEVLLNSNFMIFNTITNKSEQMQSFKQLWCTGLGRWFYHGKIFSY